MITFWESEEAIRAFAGHDISVAKYYDFDKDFLIELEPCCAHYRRCTTTKTAWSLPATHSFRTFLKSPGKGMIPCSE